VIGGNKDATSFKGIPKKAVFCVNRLEPGTSTEVVRRFLQARNISVFSCFYVIPSQPPSHQDGNEEDEDGAPRFTSMCVCIA